MASPDYQYVTIEEVERAPRTIIATVILDRSDVHNAFNDGVIAELTAVFTDLGRREDVRAIVLTGRGKSFSAGADLNWMRRMVEYSKEENVADAKRMAAMFDTIDRCPKPVIARVRGAAIGGGAGLVAVADIPVATRSTKFAFSEVRLGIIPAVISPYVIARIGAAAAREGFLTGERFDGDRARELGLIAHVVDDDDALDDKVDALIDQICQCGPHAVSAAKALIFAVADATDPHALRDETAERIAERRASAEGQDGMQAFLNKGTPSWRGSGGSQ